MRSVQIKIGLALHLGRRSVRQQNDAADRNRYCSKSNTLFTTADMVSLKLHAVNVSDNPDQLDFMRVAVGALENIEFAFYGRVCNGPLHEDVFLAQSPQNALEWICRRVSRPRLNNIIQHIYDHPKISNDNASRSEVADSDAGDDDDPIAVSAERSSPEGPITAGTKRKRPLKEKTKRQINRTLAENMNMALTVANTQDIIQARTASGTVIDGAVYREFAERLPGIGVQTAARMIAVARAVGTMEVFEDWHSIITVWNRQKMYGKNLNHRAATTFEDAIGEDSVRSTGSQQSLLIRDTQHPITSQNPIWEQTDEAGLTLSETESFRQKFLDAQKTQVDGMADYMRHRWKMDILYEEFARLEFEIRRRKEGTGARGRRYNTVAKEHLFATTYTMDLNRRPSKELDGTLWQTFGKFLDWGKRWNELKRSFGTPGIFGLLPASANSFFERYLSQGQVTHWIEMLSSCNKDTYKLAVYIEPLFLACMQESEPPAEFLFLEKLNTLTDSNVLEQLEA